MVRTVLLAVLLALPLGQLPSASAMGRDGPLVPVQFPGPPGPPDWPGGPPGWPGPTPGPQWLAHHRHCESLMRHVRRLRWRIRHSPPWVAERHMPELAMNEERLRQDCWGP